MPSLERFNWIAGRGQTLRRNPHRGAQRSYGTVLSSGHVGTRYTVHVLSTVELSSVEGGESSPYKKGGWGAPWGVQIRCSAHGVKQALFLKRARLQKQAHPHSLRTSSQVRSPALPCHCAASALRHASPAHTHTRAFTSPACRAKSCACVSETTVHPIGIRFVLRQAVGDDDHATKQKKKRPTCTTSSALTASSCLRP